MTTQKQGVRDQIIELLRGLQQYCQEYYNDDNSIVVEQSKNAIIELIDRDVIGEDEQVGFTGKRLKEMGYIGATEGRNDLRAEQRARLKGGKV